MPAYGELDANTKRLVDKALGGTKHVRKRPRPSRAGADSGEGSWRCQCGETFTAWSTAEKHGSGPGHCRIEIQMLGTMSATGGSTSHS